MVRIEFDFCCLWRIIYICYESWRILKLDWSPNEGIFLWILMKNCNKLLRGLMQHCFSVSACIALGVYQIIRCNLRTFVAIFYNFMGLQIFGLLRLDLTLYEYNIMDIEDTIMIVWNSSVIVAIDLGLSPLPRGLPGDTKYAYVLITWGIYPSR